MIQPAKKDTVRIALLATVGSVVVATLATVTTLLALHLHARMRRADLNAQDQSEQTASPQLEVETTMPARVPDHFTEEVVIPGVTSTGPEIGRQDAEEGRSPEGV